MTSPAPEGTVRDAAFDVLRRRGLDRVFANPGSTEISLLTDLPDDLRFTLALHEGSVVGLATGYATATDRPALVVLHTTAGLGNAVGALATARMNRVPLVVLVGQQDRRHLASRPFLTGDLDGLAGAYPVWTHSPPRPQDVPGALDRAFHEALTRRGPAVVAVPSDDWGAPADPRVLPTPVVVRRGRGPEPEAVAELAGLVGAARRPAIVVGADADGAAAWAALVGLAGHLGAPVWQEAFAARAGFPQDHPLFAGHLPPEREALRAALGGHDLVLVVGAPVFRQYQYSPGELVAPGTTVALVTDDAEDLHHSRADLALLADPARTVTALTAALPRVSNGTSLTPDVSMAPSSHQAAILPGPADPLDAPAVFTALAARLPADAVVVEETPSSRPDLHRLVPARDTAGVPLRGGGRARLRVARLDRRADGRPDPPGGGRGGRRLDALRRAGAVVGRALRRRGPRARHGQRPLRDHGPAGRRGRWQGAVAGVRRDRRGRARHLARLSGPADRDPRGAGRAPRRGRARARRPGHPAGGRLQPPRAPGLTRPASARRCASCLAGLAGAPAVSMPLLTVDGAPVGVSAAAAPGADLDLTDLACRPPAPAGATSRTPPAASPR